MSVVFSDGFTVGADTPLESYPSAGAPDYASILGGNNLDVNAARDRVEGSATFQDIIYRLIDAAVPTGDQKITCDVGWTTGYDAGYVGCRGNSTGNCYVIARTSSTTWNLYRVDNGTFTLLTSYSVSTTDNSSGSVSLKATGTTTVALTPTIAGSDRTTYNDSSAGRKTSGTPVVAVYQDTVSSSNFVDNVSVDNLSAGFTITVNQVTETDTVQTISKIKTKAIGQLSETNTIQTITRVKSRSLSQISETALAQAFSKFKVKVVNQVTETDLSQSIIRAGSAIPVAQVTEVDISQTISKSKTAILNQISEINFAQSVSRLKTKNIAQLSETNTAQNVTWAPKNRLLTTAFEIDVAQLISVSGIFSAKSGLSKLLKLGVSSSGVTVEDRLSEDN